MQTIFTLVIVYALITEKYFLLFGGLTVYFILYMPVLLEESIEKHRKKKQIITDEETKEFEVAAALGGVLGYVVSIVILVFLIRLLHY